MLKNLKKAVGKYQHLNAEDGYIHDYYGAMMCDTATGELWTDMIECGSWKDYHSESIINVVSQMEEEHFRNNQRKAYPDPFTVSNVNMKSVREFLGRRYGL